MSGVSLSSSFLMRPWDANLAEGLPLDIAILHWPSWRDVMPFDANLAAPCLHGIAGKLGSNVADDHVGLATLHGQLS